ncbi:MAG: metal-dependent transcriptional regulator [Spirochaetales bacterium]|nr:metal-dependent transcriptional regulator [Spirochaetales bacterium]
MQESGEMYLETILVLSMENSMVRAIDVSERMGYSKPSVSRALGILKNRGMISVDAHGSITLTTAGREHAERIYDRHNVLTRLLEHYGVDTKTATEDACRIEHYISDTSVRAIKEYMKKAVD